MVDNQLDAPNTVLSAEEIAQITEAQRRLHVLENEISIANKNLQITKRDAEKAYKDKLYQEELLINVQKEIELLTKQKSELSAQITTETDLLEKTKIETREMAFLLAEREETVSVKEKTLENNQLEFSQKVESFNKERDEFLKEKSEMVQAKEILSTAIASLPWQK